MLRKIMVIASLGILWANLSFAKEANRPDSMIGRWQMRTDKHFELKEKCYKNMMNCAENLSDFMDVLKSATMLDLKKDSCDVSMDLESLLKEFGWEDEPEAKQFIELIKPNGPGDVVKGLNWSVQGKEVIINFENSSNSRKLHLTLESPTRMTPTKEDDQKEFSGFYKIK